MLLHFGGPSAHSKWLFFLMNYSVLFIIRNENENNVNPYSESCAPIRSRLASIRSSLVWVASSSKGQQVPQANFPKFKYIVLINHKGIR